MKKDILIEIIEHLSQFSADYQSDKTYTLKDFIGYLNASVGVEKTAMRKIEGEQERQIQTIREESNSDVSILITLLFRYAKGYIKKALQNSSIQTVDEFAFLITLMTHDSLTKTELVNKQIMEKTSGVDVIKRLINQNLIQEFSDKNDKRSIRVIITPQGKEELEKVLPEMAKVSKIVVGNLTNPEINTLSYLLKKLDFFHNDIFMNKRNANLNDILNEVNINKSY
ncbi:MarR family winged helix-turn-helix transcriptional regulator [Arcicella rigui]|uniref:Winged helix DNA-binding protein n=1 Tax=Arcicella rigui TaxID=797020 RepID=A0ABU5QE15_9BACT|nr:winged helix DNA-binding protein [Arcicella rigui]MEA5141090.1 winged helix DNA-binding protein [Arcicella rigui]